MNLIYCRKRECWSLVLSICFVFAPIASADAQAPPIVIADYAVEHVGGIFGNMVPSQEYIQGMRKQVNVGGKNVNVYEVITALNAKDSYNGWVVEKSNTPKWESRSNWARVADANGSLRVEVSRGKQCSTVFKVEIVTTNKNGLDDKFEVYVTFGETVVGLSGQLLEIEEGASASFRKGEASAIDIPLSAFKLTRLDPDSLQFVEVRPNFAAVQKVTVVFEEKVLQRATQPKTSILHIHAVRAIAGEKGGKDK